MVSIQAKKHEFGWKSHGQGIENNINIGYEIRYTLDGSIPTKASLLYVDPFLLVHGEVQACAFSKTQIGSITSNIFGVVKNDWKLIDVDSEKELNQGIKAFDNNVNTYWRSNETNPHYLSLDFGKEYNLKGFTYTPQLANSEGMIESGTIEISNDGKSWEALEHFKFGNLINDPTKRNHYFDKPVKTRYIKIVSTSIAGDIKNASIAEIDFLIQ